jgi:energy-converting hydrogenase Eha subunit A
MTTPEPPEPPLPSGDGGATGPPAGPWASDYRTPPDAPPEPDPPPSLAMAVRLMYLGAVLSAVGIVVNLLQRDEIREQIAESDSSLTEDELDTAVAAGLAVSVVLGLVVIGLWIWMARSNERGQSWARTTATVLGVLSILSLLATLGMGQSTALGAVLGVISVVLAAVILFLLYRPESSRYYEARSR